MSFVHCEKSILVVPRTSPGGGLPVGCFYSEQGFGEEAEILPDFELHSGTVRSLLSEQLWRRPYLPCSYYCHNLLHECRWSKLSVLSWSEPALSGSTLGQFYFCWQPTLSSWSPSSMLWSLSSGPVDRESQQIIRTGKLLKLFLSSSLSLVLPISSLFWVSKVFLEQLLNLVVVSGPTDSSTVQFTMFEHIRAVLLSTQGFTVTLPYCFLNTEVKTILQHNFKRWRNAR